MASGKQSTDTAAHTAPPAARRRRFGIPDDLPAEFGVQSHAENHIQGFLTSDNVRDLLDGFGLQDRVNVDFPFQHIKRQHGEQWRMRIEPATTQTINGKIVHGHAWAFMRDFPETVANAA